MMIDKRPMFIVDDYRQDTVTKEWQDARRLHAESVAKTMPENTIFGIMYPDPLIFEQSYRGL